MGGLPCTCGVSSRIPVSTHQPSRTPSPHRDNHVISRHCQSSTGGNTTPQGAWCSDATLRHFWRCVVRDPSTLRRSVSKAFLVKMPGGFCRAARPPCWGKGPGKSQNRAAQDQGRFSMPLTPDPFLLTPSNISYKTSHKMYCGETGYKVPTRKLLIE